MNAMFKEIRQGNIEKIRVWIAKNPAVVNEVFTGTRPKKDIGQSPLQVAVKCGQFEIIDLLLAHGADPDFMENPADQPADTKDYYFMPMSILHDALIGAFHSLPYGEFGRAEQYVTLIETLLAAGADPNKATGPHPLTGEVRLPLDTAVREADELLDRYADPSSELESKKYGAAKKHLFQVLDLLTRHGADLEDWLDHGTYGDMTCRAALVDDFVPTEDRSYEMEFRGVVVKGIAKGDVDPHREIRVAFQEYMDSRSLGN